MQQTTRRLARMIPSGISVLVFAVCWAAAAVSPAAAQVAPSPPTQAASAPAGCARDLVPHALTLRTDDGLKLAADYYGSGRVSGPGVVLLHMIPPHFNYKSYPPEFIQALVGAGFSVVNVNRRGAPGSEGVAEAAYKGPDGWLDVKAGRDYLVRQAPCRVAPGAVVLIGASNGTTSAFDYAWMAARSAAGGAARTGAELRPPAAIVLLSAGPYSENQHSLSSLLPRLTGVPIWAAYPEREREWNSAARRQAAEAGVSWRTRLFTPGAHGTKLFGTNPEITAELVAFLRGVLADGVAGVPGRSGDGVRP